MAEIIPFEPDTDNAGVGIGDTKLSSEPYPLQAEGYGSRVLVRGSEYVANNKYNQWRTSW